jgi:hypothetical protein
VSSNQLEKFSGAGHEAPNTSFIAIARMMLCARPRTLSTFTGAGHFQLAGSDSLRAGDTWLVLTVKPSTGSLEQEEDRAAHVGPRL